MTKQEKLKKIGNKIQEQRVELGYTQKNLADKLDVDRSYIARVEAGERELKTSEIATIAMTLGVTIDFLVNDEIDFFDSLNAMPQEESFNEDSFKDLLLYILSLCGGKPNVGKTVLYKLLYYCDTDYYEYTSKYGEPARSITGMHFRKFPQGPVPNHYADLVSKLEDEGYISRLEKKYYGKTQYRLLINNQYESSHLNTDQKAIVKNVVDALSDMNASEISDYSHSDPAWIVTDYYDCIDWDLIDTDLRARKNHTYKHRAQAAKENRSIDLDF